MSVGKQDDAYNDGRRAARSAISAGFPRWAVLDGTDSSAENSCIHHETGLPTIVIHVLRSLLSKQRQFVRGHNDEILAAISDGDIKRDFRQLVMSAGAVAREFARGKLGRLDLDIRRLTSKEENVAVEIEVPKARRGPPPKVPRDRPSWIVLRRGKSPPQRLLIYERPVQVAIVRDGRVLIVRYPDMDLTFDVETGQILNRHPRR